MSSDAPANITPNYHVQWKDLFGRLVKSIIGEQVVVETCNENEIAVIKSKTYVLCTVFRKDSFHDNKQHVGIVWKNHFEMKRERKSYFNFPGTAKSILEGDVVCVLQGASKPAIIRPRST
jgi:hypothetical protein